MSACQGCGATLPPKTWQGRDQKWCSARCRKAQYGGTCIECGARTDGSNGRAVAPIRCLACDATPERMAQRSRDGHAYHAEHRRQHIIKRWGEGALIREIAAELGTTPGAIHLNRYRQAGYDVPHRYAM